MLEANRSSTARNRKDTEQSFSVVRHRRVWGSRSAQIPPPMFMFFADAERRRSRACPRHLLKLLFQGIGRYDILTLILLSLTLPLLSLKLFRPSRRNLSSFILPPYRRAFRFLQVRRQFDQNFPSPSSVRREVSIPRLGPTTARTCRRFKIES